MPVLSFNHSAGAEGRVRETLRWAVGISEAVMAMATAVFCWRPRLCSASFRPAPSILETGVAGFADHLPQLYARRRCHDAHRLFPGHRPERAEPLCHRAAAGGAAGAPGLGVPLRRADVCLADLPGDRGAVGALRTGFLPEDALPVKTAEMPNNFLDNLDKRPPMIYTNTVEISVIEPCRCIIERFDLYDS